MNLLQIFHYFSLGPVAKNSNTLLHVEILYQDDSHDVRFYLLFLRTRWCLCIFCKVHNDHSLICLVSSSYIAFLQYIALIRIRCPNALNLGQIDPLRIPLGVGYIIPWMKITGNGLGSYPVPSTQVRIFFLLAYLRLQSTRHPDSCLGILNIRHIYCQSLLFWEFLGYNHCLHNGQIQIQNQFQWRHYIILSVHVSYRHSFHGQNYF